MLVLDSRRLQSKFQSFQSFDKFVKRCHGSDQKPDKTSKDTAAHPDEGSAPFQLIISLHYKAHPKSQKDSSFNSILDTYKIGINQKSSKIIRITTMNECC